MYVTKKLFFLPFVLTSISLLCYILYLVLDHGVPTFGPCPLSHSVHFRSWGSLHRGHVWSRVVTWSTAKDSRRVSTWPLHEVLETLSTKLEGRTFRFLGLGSTDTNLTTGQRLTDTRDPVWCIGSLEGKGIDPTPTICLKYLTIFLLS